MGGCQSSQNSKATPLRRKGDLLEAESNPYLAADETTQPNTEQKAKDIEVDAKGLEGKTKNGPEKKSSQKTIIGSGSAATTADEGKAAVIEASIPKPAEGDQIPAKCPPYALIYDEKKEEIKLVHWDKYEKHYLPGILEEREKYLGKMRKAAPRKKPSQEVVKKTAAADKAPDAADKASDAADKASDAADKAPDAAKPSLKTTLAKESDVPRGPLTLVYDAENQYVKLISWDEYVARHQGGDIAHWERSSTIKTAPAAVKPVVEPAKPAIVPVPSAPAAPATPAAAAAAAAPCAPSAAIYDEISQTVKLISWDVYLKEFLPIDLAVRKEKELMRFQQHKRQREIKEVAVDKPAEQPKAFVASYNDKKQEVYLQDYALYRPSYQQDYAMIYNPKKQSVDLIYWKDYVENHEAKFKSEWTKKEAGAAKVATPLDLTAVYDPATQGIELVTWDKYLEENKPAKQDWMAEYDEVTQSVKLAFWREYQPQVRVGAEGKSRAAPKLANLSQDLTTIYDAESEGVKLVSLDDFWTTNKAPKQDWMAEYDDATQSVVLAFWKPFEGSSPTEIRHPKTKGIKNSSNSGKSCLTPSLTTVYNEESQSVDLISYDEFLRCNKIPKQDYAAVYDEINQCVKLIYWKDYQESQRVEDCQKSHPIQSVRVDSITINPKELQQEFQTVIANDLEISAE